MKFKAVTKIKFAESNVELDSDLRETYEEAREDGEISKVIWGDEFIDYRIEEV